MGRIQIQTTERIPCKKCLGFIGCKERLHAYRRNKIEGAGPYTKLGISGLAKTMNCVPLAKYLYDGKAIHINLARELFGLFAITYKHKPDLKYLKKLSKGIIE